MKAHERLWEVDGRQAARSALKGSSKIHIQLATVARKSFAGSYKGRMLCAAG